MSISVLFAVTVALLVCFEDGVDCHHSVGARHQLVVAVLVDEKDKDRRVVRKAIAMKVKELNATFEQANIIVKYFTGDGTEAGVIKQYFDANYPHMPQLIIALDRYYGALMLAQLCSASNTLLLNAAGGADEFLYDYMKFVTYVTPIVGVSAAVSLVKTVMYQYGWTRTFIVAATSDYYQAQANHLLAYLDEFYDPTLDHRKRTKNYMFPFNADIAAGRLGPGKSNYLKRSLRELLKKAIESSSLVILLVPPKYLRYFWARARKMDMFKGDYAFLTFHAGESEDYNPDNITAGYDYTGLLTLDRNDYQWSPDYDDFVYNRLSHSATVPEYFLKMSALVYDGLTLWGMALDEMVKRSPNSKLEDIALEANTIADLFRKSSLQGLSGPIAFAKNGSRYGNFTLSIFQGRNATKKLYSYDSLTNKTQKFSPKGLIWPGGRKSAPRQPSCFRDECAEDKAKERMYLTIIAASSVCGVTGVIVTTVLVSALIWKRHQEKQLISSRQIKWKEVTTFEDADNETLNNQQDRRSRTSSIMTRHYTTAGMYRGTVIAIKHVQRNSVNILGREIYKELKQMLYIKHENVNYFVGVCAEPGNVCVAMAYADRGSLQNVLADPQLEIDWDFRMSFAMDVTKGMGYLHDKTPIGAHGHLTSSNCVVDGRWNCKITDYGLKVFRSLDKTSRSPHELLWTAPELLSKKETDLEKIYGTKPGDVYSFGVIISELLTGELPYHDGLQGTTLEEILGNVETAIDPPFRPTLPPAEDKVAEGWADLAVNCWDANPFIRPPFKSIKDSLLAANSGRFTNVLERMQNYLEETNEKANVELDNERRKADAMMHDFLPKAVVEKINAGKEVPPERAESAVLCLCDSTGIYQATNELPAVVVVDILISVYRKYDEIIAKHEAYEVSTWGSKDSLLIAGGLSVNEGVGPSAVCEMAIELMSCVESFSHPRLEKRSIRMKITVHMGPVYTALIGKQIPQFCVFGETVHQIVSLHAVSRFMTIRVTQPVRDSILPNGKFKMAEGGQVSITGDKEMPTYFVTGVEDNNRSLPVSVKHPVQRKRSKSISSGKRK